MPLATPTGRTFHCSPRALIMGPARLMRSRRPGSRSITSLTHTRGAPPAPQSTSSPHHHPTRTAERTSLATSDPATTHCVATRHPRHFIECTTGPRDPGRPRNIILPAHMSLHGAPAHSASPRAQLHAEPATPAPTGTHTTHRTSTTAELSRASCFAGSSGRCAGA